MSLRNSFLVVLIFIAATGCRAQDQPGAMDAAQMKAALDRVRMMEYRINDLLTDVHVERWKLPDAARDSVRQTVAALGAQARDMADWRGQFEKRTDSVYLGFELFAAINAVLPSVETIARIVSEHETPAFGAEFSRAGNELSEVQQTMGSYLRLLLRNQDAGVLALENNLAGCERNLGEAMRERSVPAKSLKNAPPVRPHRKRAQGVPGGSGAPAKEPGPGKEGEKK